MDEDLLCSTKTGGKSMGGGRQVTRGLIYVHVKEFGMLCHCPVHQVLSGPVAYLVYSAAG